ncbi:MAG: sensor histidine kinase [Candidatus Cryptobacteroides sp.]
MKTKINTTVKVIIFAAIITAAAVGLFLFLSIAFDQKFFNWLYKRFFIDMGYATFLNGGKWHVYDLKWDTLKEFIYTGGAVMATAWAASIVITFVLVRRSTQRQTAQELEQLMRRYFAKEDKKIFPNQYENMADYTVLLKEQFQNSEERLRAESVRKNELVAYLAHDLKTPLTSVIGYISLLKEAPDMPVEQRAKYTGIALEKALRLESLINEFFDITRYNLQEIVLEEETFDLGFLLMQMADEFYPVLEQHGKSISIHADEDLPVAADSAKLARVFNNILKNAVAYSYDNTEIEIYAEKRENTIHVSISNFGKTIPKQKLDRIFEKFYRLDDARSTNTGGAGLGLAIAKEIIVAHGGTISVTSEKQITTFTVELPAQNAS